jgi:hypothetical protein
MNAELRHTIGVDGGVRAPVNSKLGREFENWRKTSVGMMSNLVPFRSSRQATGAPLARNLFERNLFEQRSAEICREPRSVTVHNMQASLLPPAFP